MSRRWLAVSLIAGVLSAALVRASSQAPAAVSQPQPVFRVGVDAVRIDAVVTDKDGRIVTDLTAKDFELRQDGSEGWNDNICDKAFAGRRWREI